MEESLERDLELLCLTGVEDKLQDDVRPTLELLRNAGIKVSWKGPVRLNRRIVLFPSQNKQENSAVSQL